MIIGIGLDIVEVSRISKALEGSQSLTDRVFSAKEIAYCSERKNKFQHFAGRFAAKEAALKALGTGWQKGIRWKDVETAAGPLGKPELNFHRKAKLLFDGSGATRALVTITHASAYAVAVVILES